MVRLVDLGKSIVDAEKISYIGAVDTKVQHDVKKSTVISFVQFVVDGNLITIQDHNKEEVTRIRNLLILECAPQIRICPNLGHM